MFTPDNTTGYTQEQLDAINAELVERLDGINEDDAEYQQVVSRFSDEIARR